MSRAMMVLLFIAFSLNAAAQKKLAFHSQNTVGLLEGQASSAFQLQSVNGFQYKTWFAGVGTGLDYYYFRSIPLFVSLQKDLFDKSRTLFFNVDGGVNFFWDDEDEATRFNSFIRTDFKPSLYCGGGLGYKIGLKNKKDAVLVNLGYSFKRLKEEREISTFCINPPCPTTIEHYDYSLNRLSLKLGWQF
jgi:hypothetical protein